jgi:non-ribosomal peptide synthetase component E (peptide arylation enzyme)
MPDPEMGERVCAFVVLKDGVSLTLEEVGDHFKREGATRQKTPERVIVVEDLPRTPSGKVKKVDLRSRLREEARAAAI